MIRESIERLYKSKQNVQQCWIHKMDIFQEDIPKKSFSSLHLTKIWELGIVCDILPLSQLSQVQQIIWSIIWKRRFIADKWNDLPVKTSRLHLSQINTMTNKDKRHTHTKRGQTPGKNRKIERQRLNLLTTNCSFSPVSSMSTILKTASKNAYDFKL